MSVTPKRSNLETSNPRKVSLAISFLMNVPLLDLQAQYASLRTALLDAVTRVMDSQRFVLGENVLALEKSLAEYSQSKYAIACASGSDALLLALMALDLREGHEVITTPFTFFATGAAITRLGARPVFVDIDPATYNIDPEKTAAAITERTRAILPVHLYGQCADMDQLLKLGVPVIEDAAQAVGAEDRGRRAGSMGLAGCFSFYPTKNLGGAGDGGLLTTNDQEFADRLRRLRTHGGVNEYEHSEVGINSRLDELQAAVLRVKLDHLDEWSNKRAEKAARYTQLLGDATLKFELVTPFVRDDSRHIFHQYIVRVPEHRDALSAHLKERGVGTKIYYPLPLHLQDCFSYLTYSAGQLPEAELAAKAVLALPLFPELSETQQDYVVETIQGFEP